MLPKIDISLASASPEMRALLMRRDELHRRRLAIQSDLEPVLERLRRGSHGEAPPAVSAGVMAALGDLAEKILPRRRNSTDEAIYADSRQELANLDEAIALLNFEIEKLVPPASVVIRERVREEHDRRAHALVHSLIEAGKRAADYQELADALNAERVWWAELEAVHFPPLGNPADRHSPLRSYFRELLKGRHLTPRDLPAEWR